MLLRRWATDAQQRIPLRRGTPSGFLPYSRTAAIRETVSSSTKLPKHGWITLRWIPCDREHHWNAMLPITPEIIAREAAEP